MDSIGHLVVKRFRGDDVCDRPDVLGGKANADFPDRAPPIRNVNADDITAMLPAERDHRGCRSAQPHGVIGRGSVRESVDCDWRGPGTSWPFRARQRVALEFFGRANSARRNSQGDR